MAASILGATVMPHAIYLHSTLVNDHYAGGEKPSIKTQLRGSKIDVAWALLLAGTVNLAMLVLAANSLHGMSGTDSIDGAQRAIAQVLGPVIGTIFLHRPAGFVAEFHIGWHVRRLGNHARPAAR